MNTQAIRYIIYKCIEEYKKIKNIDTNTFNNTNNFTFEKCLLLPYIITIANGHKEKLLNGIFNNSFYPKLNERDGVVVYDNNDLNNIIPHTIDSLGLLFVNNKLQDNFELNEFQTINQDWKLYIDKSFEFLLKFRDKEFPLHNVDMLETISMSNFAFENMEALYKNNQDIEVTNIIRKFQFFTERSRFFYSSNPEFGLKFNWEIESNNLVVE